MSGVGLKRLSVGMEMELQCVFVMMKCIAMSLQSISINIGISLKNAYEDCGDAPLSNCIVSMTMSL